MTEKQKALDYYYASDVANKDKRGLCTYCDGDGWTSEHDPSDTSYEHMSEGVCSSCPVQMGCDECQGNGYVIGHPPQLQDWLALLGGHYGVDGVGGLYSSLHRGDGLPPLMKFNLSDGQPANEEDYKALNKIISK